MKPPSIVIDHFLSTKWSKKLFTINHYELQNGKCIVTQELSAYYQEPTPDDFMEDLLQENFIEDSPDSGMVPLDKDSIMS